MDDLKGWVHIKTSALAFNKCHSNGQIKNNNATISIGQINNIAAIPKSFWFITLKGMKFCTLSLMFRTVTAIHCNKIKNIPCICWDNVITTKK